jgi:hypothetical protein
MGEDATLKTFQGDAGITERIKTAKIARDTRQSLFLFFGQISTIP